jgi:GT2 family glycosyltransferase
MSHNVSLTFACYNQREYTQRCIESLARSGTDLSRVVAVDNLSTDDTLSYLEQSRLGAVIANQANYGCGVAWNQGALALQSDWTVVMNNDIVVSHGWLNALLDRALELGWLVVSPAMIEGPLDYDLEEMAAKGRAKLGQHTRSGQPHAVCMAIHRSVWQKVGFFRATPRLLGYEDSIFFAGVKRENIPCGTVGSSWIHHFGSITQTALKRERGLRSDQGLGERFHAEIGRKGWFSRKLDKFNDRRLTAHYRQQEMVQAQMSLHGERRDGQFFWL